MENIKKKLIIRYELIKLLIKSLHLMPFHQFLIIFIHTALFVSNISVYRNDKRTTIYSTVNKYNPITYVFMIVMFILQCAYCITTSSIDIIFRGILLINTQIDTKGYVLSSYSVENVKEKNEQEIQK